MALVHNTRDFIWENILMTEILSTLLFGVTMLVFVMGLSCIVMGVISSESGAAALKERIEYGFMGVSGIVVAALLFFAA